MIDYNADKVIANSISKQTELLFRELDQNVDKK